MTRPPARPPESLEETATWGALPRGVVAGRRARPGQQIGRYVVLHPVGSGAMGVVYGAYDPELDRKVALKLLHRLEAGAGDDALQANRLLREAQAMARLAHPNVVTVHDVGTHEGQVFVAMEFVPGKTLSEWLRGGRRPWAEVLEVFEHAGKGLWAAHEQGLVHRDFKPDNVLVGEDGRVRVLDFGLVAGSISADRELRATLSDVHAIDGEDEEGDAEPGEGAGAPEAEQGRALSSSSSFDLDLTQTGAMLGTPAYMSPEQFGRRHLDARSDQFSFCAALHEGLYGARPFEGESFAVLAAAVLEGRRRAPPADAEVPSWLDAIVDRGLSVEPEARWPDMGALLEALATGRARSELRGARPWARVVGLSLVLAAVAGASWWIGRERSEAPPAPAVCEDASAAIDAVWNEAQRERLRGSLSAAHAAYGADAWAAVEAPLDRYAADWASMRRDACEATHVRRVQSEALLDRRMLCLDRRREGFAAVVDVLGGADATVAERSVSIVSELEPLEPCADAARLLEDAAVPRDEGTRARLERTNTLVARGRTARVAGRLDEAARLAEEAVALTVGLEQAPERADALLFSAAVLLTSGETQAAAEGFDRAVEAALRSGDEHLLAQALAEQAAVVGFNLGEGDQGKRLAGYARAPLAAIAPAPRTEARLENALGLIAFGEADYAAATRHFERVRELHEDIWGPEHPRTADILNNLGAIAFERGDFEGSRRYHERTLKIWKAAFGPAHPDVAVSLNNLGTVADATKEPEVAQALYSEALAIRLAAFGEEHPAVAMTTFNLGLALATAGRHEQAVEQQRRALELWEAELGPDHRNLAGALSGMAASLVELGALDEAFAANERARRIRAGEGIDPTDYAETEFVAARIALARGDRTAALAAGLEARRTFEAVVARGNGGEDERDAVQAWLDESFGEGAVAAGR